LPIAIGLGLLVFNRRPKWIWLIAGSLTLVLTALALWLPIGEITRLGPLSLDLSSEFTLLGRRLALTASESGIVVLVYAHAALWIWFSPMTGTHRYYVPLSLLFSALLLGMLLVEPIIFAPLLGLLAALAAVPMLTRPGQPTGLGLMRMVTFQALGAPFVLFAGSLLESLAPSNPQSETGLAMVLIGFGFALMLGIFPFHAWLPAVANQAHPHAVAFIFQLQPVMIALFGFGFFDQIPWLRVAPEFFAVLRLIGMLTLLAGGIWVAFQRNLARIFGHLAVAETGLLLAALGMGPASGQMLFFGLILARAPAYLLWSLAYSRVIHDYPSTDLEDLKGLMLRSPLVATAILISIFSIAGVPLLASFPQKVVFLGVAAPIDAATAVAALLSSLGLLAAGLRMLWEFVSEPLERSESAQPITRWTRTALLSGIVLLLVIGLIPQPITWLAARLPGPLIGLGGLP
jgi:formate hydrogenlyase subunit 3/multisubunit Na+/H+ antiporter MnhD subunit